jgi:hypothetical protein
MSDSTLVSPGNRPMTSVRRTSTKVRSSTVVVRIRLRWSESQRVEVAVDHVHCRRYPLR